MQVPPLGCSRDEKWHAGVNHFLSWFRLEHLCLCQDSKLETLCMMLYSFKYCTVRDLCPPGILRCMTSYFGRCLIYAVAEAGTCPILRTLISHTSILWTVSIGFAPDSTKLRLQKALLSVTLTFDLLRVTVLLLSYKLLCPKAVFCLISVCDLDGLKEKL